MDNMNDDIEIINRNVINPDSTTKPPSRIAIVLVKLITNKKKPFANSGASFADELIVYCAIGCNDPSKSPNSITITDIG